MTDSEVRIISGRQVETALAGREAAVADVVRTAYRAHGRRADLLPQASILRFPDRPADRIIALPAGLGTEAGVKWISSFPANTAVGIERASAVILLNSMDTGRVQAVVEGSLISAYRTAASAALTASAVHDAAAPSVLGLIGCGRINFEIFRFLLAVGPPIGSIVVHDLDPSRAAAFIDRCAQHLPGTPIVSKGNIDDTLAACSLVSIATTAQQPYIGDLTMCPPGATILHISLRDITPEAILATENVVDDVDHICAAQTSVHLAEQLVGHRDFIRTTICDVLLGESPARIDKSRPLVFSPFGMGTLDVAVAGMVLTTVGEQALTVSDFWPAEWSSGRTPAAPAGEAGR